MLPTFQKFLEAQTSLFVADMNNYELKVKNYIQEFVERHNYEVDEHLETKIDFNKLVSLLHDFPQTQALITALKTKQNNKAKEILNFYHNWRQHNINRDNFLDVYDIMRIIHNQVRGESAKITPKQANEWYQSIVQESQKNMNIMKQAVEQAMSRVEEWSDSKITMKPRLDEKNITETIASASVYVDKADFTIFYAEGKIFVDDILEYGD